MKTAVVAGGAGFIGANLCERLMADGLAVVCVDNLITGRRANIEHLLGNPAFRFVQRDITGALDDIPPAESIYHLASPASPPAYVRYPLETIRASTEGTFRLLDLAARDGARFLYASTSEVYGDPIEHPQREDSPACTNPVGPRSMYHEAKRCGEAIVTAYHREHDVDARIVRIFNVYGPRSDPDDGRVVPNFVCQALANQPLTVYGDGSQTRSLCYVDDMVEGLVRAMSSDQARGEVINLGNPAEHTVLQYAERIRSLSGSSSPITHLPATDEDPRRRRPDISKAHAILDWRPAVNLETGLKRTIAYFRDEMASSASTSHLVEAR